MPVVAAVAGVLLVSGAVTAQGTDLRAGRRTELTDLIASRQFDISRKANISQNLERQLGSLAGEQSPGGAGSAPDALSQAAGLTALRGRGVTVSLDDAPRPAGATLPEGIVADDLVVHQQDVQGVVNALWAGGAQGISVMNRRMIATSAVRCVGNTLVLQGQVYSPPFVIAAVGDPQRMQRALDASPEVAAYRTWVDAVGLGYKVRPERGLTLPAYEGSLNLVHARRVT